MFFLNDLSIDGQFSDPGAFILELRRLLDARERSGLVKKSLLCSRLLGDRPATATQTFRAVVQTHSDKDLRQRILRWVGQSGPFWEDEQATVPDDLFYFNEDDVTLQGLGEAARRRILGAKAAVYSLPGSGNGCDADPLLVTHGLLEDKIGEIEVPNHISVESMESAAKEALPTPKNWTELLATVEAAFEAVTLSQDIAGVLRPHPFSQNVADRVLELVGILDQLVKSRDERRQYTDVSYGLIANFFSGSAARFTDESATNKHKYRAEMTFPDPDAPGSTVFCPFHGKINQPAYRIHIRWPLEAQHDKILIAYIGPKITV